MSQPSEINNERQAVPTSITGTQPDDKNLLSSSPLEQQSGSDEDIELMKYKQAVENKKMFFILCLATLYCLVAAIGIGCFIFNIEAFTGEAEGTVMQCYYVLSSGDANPVNARTIGSTDIANLFLTVLKVGFGIHVLGIIADGCFAIRIYYKGECFNYAAIVLEVFYSLLYVVWLIWI